MSGIVWEDPPPDGRHGGRSDQIAAALDQLREHPGQWARIATVIRGSASNIAFRISMGHLPAARPRGSFEAVSRTLTDGSAKAVYARYVGEPEAGS